MRQNGKAAAVFAAALFGMIAVTAAIGGAFVWVISLLAPIPMWAAGLPLVAIGTIAAVLFMAWYWVADRVGRYIEWLREEKVVIDGLAVRPRVMRLVLPREHWDALRVRAEQQDAAGPRA